MVGWRSPWSCVLALVALSAAGCTEPQKSESTSPLAPTAEAAVIRFSEESNAGVAAYAKREHLLDAELAKVGAKIEWVPAAGAFSANFEAMNAGVINTSRAAVSPIIGALSHNLKFRIFAVCDPGTGIQSAVISPKGSPIRRLEDLVGKRVAVNLAAHGDYVLLRALEQRGIPADKVERVPIQPPDAAAAFATGKIDAWSTFGVFLTTAIKNGANVLVSESEIKSDDIGVVSAHVDTLEQNPAAFRTLLKVFEDVTRIGHAAPEKLQNVFTDKGPTAVSGYLLQAAIDETRSAPIFRVPTATDKERIARVARLLYQNKSIDREINVDDIVFDIDAAASAKAARLDKGPS